MKPIMVDADRVNANWLSSRKKVQKAIKNLKAKIKKLKK